MKNLIGIIGICTLLLAVAQHSFAQFSLTGDFRPRASYRHGYGSLASPNQDAAFFIQQRSRLNLRYESEKFRIGFSPQDVRVWGSTPQLNLSDGFLSLHEAWGEVVFSEKFSVKVGRQELVYDDQRMFGNVDWALQGRSHDVALLQYEGDFKAHVGVAYNQDGVQSTTNLYTVPNNYKTMQFLWVNKEFDPITTSLLFINNGLQYTQTDTAGMTSASVKYGQTAGARLIFKKGKVKVAGNFYYQMGKDGANRNIQAYEGAAEVSVALVKQITTTLGYEYMSGTDMANPPKGENNSFSPLFGTNHKFNGFMDYFYVGNHGNNVGLQDAYFKLKYIAQKFSAQADAHLFMTAADLPRAGHLTQALAANLGTEIDLTLKYEFSGAVNFAAGYSQMFATETMEALKGGDKDETNNWAYLMLVIKPDFLKKKEKVK